MPFKYACFISYRHGQNKLTERIINDLYVALTSELGQYFEEGVYLDRERLNGGAYVEKQLAQALCESVCLIVIFTPLYLHPTHPYCARELRAMEILEEKRFQALQQMADRASSLIIPVVFRGEDEMPAELKERVYYDFQDFDPTQPSMSKAPRYYAKIRRIAAYIRARYNQFRALGNDPCGGCEEFKLPQADSDEVKRWLHASTAPFPAREGVTQ
jgi:hypothetical protein